MRTCRRILLPLVGFLCALPLAAQQEIVIDITGGGPGAHAYLNGFRSALSGATITYHSSHPDAEEALICRARRDAGAISWQGDAPPDEPDGGVYRFAWLAGLERIGWGNPNGVRTFHFFVDDREYFTFHNRKDSTAPAWTVKRPDGAALGFRASFTDRFGDLFGMMDLALPKGDVAPGRPLTFRVESEDAGAPEWFMVFKHAFNFTPRVRVEPARLRTPEGGALPLRVSVDNLVPGRRVRITDGERVLLDTALAIGANVHVVPAGGGSGDRRIVSRLNGGTLSADTLPAGAAGPSEIWLIPHAHTDIGYTDLQPEVEKKHWRNLDLALDLIARTKANPPGSRFKWNMEVLWPLESYMANASPARRREVIDAVRDGSLGLNALLVNPLTGLATAPEMDHYTDYARKLEAEYSIDIPTAAVSDIPGFTWGIVSSLARSGVRYFASAPNSGDRIGYVIEAQGDRPFRWKSQSGEDSVLFWVAGSSYAYFHEGTLTNLGPEKLMKLLRKVAASGYPYSMYFLPYTLGDNGGPDTSLPEFVKHWNELYETPKLVIATHREMFEEFERRHGKDLPVERGDFTPYWEDGAGSTAGWTGTNRQVVDRLTIGSAISSMRSPAGYPAEEYAKAWRLVSLWDEHTWGADISVSSPDSPKTTGQWEIKRGYVQESDNLSAALLGPALGEKNAHGVDLPGAEIPGAAETAGRNDTVLVYNPASWARTDLVTISGDKSRAGDLVTDESGKPLPSQRLSSGELAVLIEMAPLSAKRLIVHPGGPHDPGDWPGGIAGASPAGLYNEHLDVTVDTSTGAVSRSVWRGREFSITSPGLNRYLYVPGTNPESAKYVSKVHVLVRDAGPLVARLSVSGAAPGCDQYLSEIRIVAGIDRIDLRTRLNKNGVREKEGGHIAFPFSIDGVSFRYDVAGSIVTAGIDQLDGSCMNYVSVQSWADVSDASRGITWTTADAPLAEPGGINAESPWMKSPRISSRFYSYIFNNYWHTNYKADQEGAMEFRYSLHPHGPFDAAQSVRWGRERRLPLYVSRVGSKDPLPPLFILDPPEVIAESVVPVDSGEGILVLLYNSAASAAAVSMRSADGGGMMVSPSGPSGAPAGPAAEEIRILAYGSRYVRVEPERRYR